MPGKVIVGGRAKIFVDNQLVGIFESCTLSSAIATEPIFILGKYVADEIAITAKDVVNVACSGFRVVGQGKHVLPKVPKVQDLLNFEPFVISVTDRQSGKTLETVIGCVPTTDNTNYNARATSRVSVNYQGILASNEDGDQSDAGAVSLP